MPPLGRVSSGSIEWAAWPASERAGSVGSEALGEAGRAREPGPCDGEVDRVQEPVRPRQERAEDDGLEVAPARDDATEEA